MLSSRFKNDGKPTKSMNVLQESMKKQVEKKIAKGIYSFENVRCCICSKSRFQLLSEKDRYGLYHPVVICRDCGLVQANPRMTQESYSEFYEIEYQKLNEGTDAPANEFFEDQCQRGSVIYQYLTENLGKPIVGYFILEIGCSTGGILHYFREKGNEVYGVDLDIKYLEFGRANYNLPLELGTIDNVIRLGRSPDLVIYSHVLEHILDPVSELTKLRLILTRDSFLYIELPGNKNLRRSSYESDFLKALTNAHAYYFSQRSLRNLLPKAGYEFVCGDEVIHSIFRKSVANAELDKGLYVITNDYADAMASFRRAEFFRPVLLFYKNIKNLRIWLIRALVSFLKIVRLYSFAKKIYLRVK